MQRRQPDHCRSVVAALVIGLPAYVLVKVLIPGFFARKDTRTPVYTAGISLIINVVFNLILIPDLRYHWPGSGWRDCRLVQLCAMLYFMLHTRGHYHVELSLLWRIGRITLSAAGMGAVLIYAAPLGEGMYNGTVWQRVGSIAALVSVGALVYAVLALVTGAVDRKKFNMLMGRDPALAKGRI